jgi:tetratricopeptide (TPR) repeat protein
VHAGFSGQSDQADSLFSRLYPSLRNNRKFLFTYGSYRARAEDYRKALPLLDQARPAFTGPHLYLLLGTCYRQTGQFGKAEKSFIHAVRIRPQRIYPRYLLAKLYRKEGRRQKAVREARQLLQIKPKVVSPAGRQIKQKMRTFIK